MIYFNPQLALLFVVLMALAFAYFSMTQAKRDASSDNAIATSV
jgi:ethanolamine permease